MRKLLVFLLAGTMLASMSSCFIVHKGDNGKHKGQQKEHSDNGKHKGQEKKK